MKQFSKKQVVSKLRDAFRVEALEPRVLLSADPVLGSAALVVPDAMVQTAPGHDYLTSGALALSHVPVDQVQAGAGPAAVAPDRHIIDLAELARQPEPADGNFTVAANDILKGSGTLNVAILNNGIVAPGYSPGMQTVESYTQTSSATLQIEIGGLEPGSGYDQINMGHADLAGKLEVSLTGGFKPLDGQVFEFMHFDTVSGKFELATGLVQAGDDIFFELVQDAHSLKLVTHVLDPVTQAMIDTVGGDAADGVGYFLNNDYFPSIPPLSFHASLNLGGSLYLYD